MRKVAAAAVCDHGWGTALCIASVAPESQHPTLRRAAPPAASMVINPLGMWLWVQVLPREPNSFSPNPASPVVDAIGLPAFAMASPDIPNSAIHFRTILFSPSVLGESLWLAG
jgi:hypothetical protein